MHRARSITLCLRVTLFYTARFRRSDASSLSIEFQTLVLTSAQQIRWRVQPPAADLRV